MGRVLTQRDLIEELIAHDNVLELARDVAENGYVPVEALVAVEEDDKTIVLEGNRRLAALKVLQNPSLAPAANARQLKKLQGADTPEKVRVLIAPTRDDAAPLILRKHTREQIERWSRLMQARFYRKLVGAGESLEAVAKRYGVTRGDIVDFLRMDTMYEIAQSLDLPDDVRDKVQDPRGFPASVLERLLEMPDFRAHLRLEFDDRGGVVSRAKPKDFRRAYGRVVSDVVNRVVDTRKLNTTDAPYVKSLAKSALPAQSRKYSKGELIGAAKPAAPPPAPTPAPEPRARNEVRTLVPSTLRCNLRDDRTRAIFKEIRSLKPTKKYANAHAVLLRVLLELAVGHYLTVTNLIDPLLEWGRKQNKPRDWSPTLSQMLRELMKAPEVKMRPLARKAVTRLIGDDRRSVITVDTLDGFVHNNFEWPEERELVRLWRALEDIMAIVLKDPRPEASPGGRT